MSDEVIKLRLDTTDAKRQLDDVRRDAQKPINATLSAAADKLQRVRGQNEARFNASMVGLEGGGWGGRVGAAFTLGGYGTAAMGAAAAGLWGTVGPQIAVAQAGARGANGIGGTAGAGLLEELRATGQSLNEHPILAGLAGANMKDVASVTARLDQVTGVRDAVAARVDAILGPVAQGGRATVDKATVDAVTAQAIQEQVALAKQQADDLRSANEHLAEISEKLGAYELGGKIRAADAGQGAGSRR